MISFIGMCVFDHAPPQTRGTNAGVILGQRRIRWPTIGARILVRVLVFT